MTTSCKWPKAPKVLEAGYVYAPYVPIQVTETIMIPVDKLALLRCHHCEQKFKNNDEVYSIISRRYSEYDLGFTELKNAQTNDGLNVAVPREVNFHRECFLEIAGDEYAP